MKTLMIALAASLALGTAGASAAAPANDAAVVKNGSKAGWAVARHGADDPAGDDRGGNRGGGSGRGGNDDGPNHT